MTARRFDPAKTRTEMGPEPVVDWDTLISRVSSVDNRDLRDPKKIGARLLRKKRVAPKAPQEEQ